VRYWRAVETQVQEILEPPVETTQYPTRKKRANRGLGSGRTLGEDVEGPKGTVDG
jgi:hypothetical protein